MNLSRRDLLLASSALMLAGNIPWRSALATEGAPLTKPIPAADETLPVIGIGTARRYQGASAEALVPLREAFQRFVAQGGRVIDTAPSYGDAERVVGELIASLDIRDQLFLATKVSSSGREAGVAQIERSFELLGTEMIDLVAVHNFQDTETQLETLRDYRDQGRVRYVGATTWVERQHDEMVEWIERGGLDFVQVDYAIDNRAAAETVLPAAEANGVAVMVNLPFGRDRLFDKVQGQALPDWAAEIDCRSWAQFFLKYVVSHPAVTCAIPGMANPRYVDDNLGAAVGRMPDAGMRRRMEALIDSL
ncbi:aldo/keto reductase [Halotalea alkalilenta]|uniref:Aldo/keto reductase n=1 Tax=Halotalea alkalilenta TaxID=376489 RepID=A0A172YI66_9GAMM|nr:aldo/keto reductase [Halotalea alkalilenta]ANF58832.1 aldo/keto reductase [Halotalea alkalilenta]